MDLDIIRSTEEGEITQFLCDVRDYFKASLATSEYENTSNLFYLTAAETTEKLLIRCESLLNRLNNKCKMLPSLNMTTNDRQFSSTLVTNSEKGEVPSNMNSKRDKHPVQHEEVSYLDMSAGNIHTINNKNISLLKKSIDFDSRGVNSKTFRCSKLVVEQNKSFLHRAYDKMSTTEDNEVDEDEVNENCDSEMNNFVDDPQIYDICQVTTLGSDGEEDEIGIEETVKAITSDSHISLPNIDCPYMDLPAGHLSIHKSTKYGQLQRIEKRMFFDQSKKCYCGILDDWLLCYAEGPTSNRPTIYLYLKMPGIEIEHFGEGKRRDVCFQISTCDPNKRFIFQAVNEIDAKEWIHAIEAAIRNDFSGTDVRNSSTRKLPTPPIMKKVTFLDSFQKNNEVSTSTISNDCIYEEPSPIHHILQNKTIKLEKPPELPNKQTSPSALAKKFEYDVPKCPPQPIKCFHDNDANLRVHPYTNNRTDSHETKNVVIATETCFLTQSSSVPNQKYNSKIEENLEFQAKVKDVHNKLTSQLSSIPNMKKPFKKTVTSTSQNVGESSTGTTLLPSYCSISNATAELKKQKKSTTPQSSPQKLSTEKPSFTKNWFLNRLNKTTSSTRSNTPSPSNSPSKCKQSEKENLLNSSSDVCDSYDVNDLNNSLISPISKTSSPTSGSKVNMIINQLEASGHLASIFCVDAVASFNSFCDNDCNNYEPIMTVSTPPTSFMKKV